MVFGRTQGFAAVFPLASLYPDGGGDGSLGFVLAGIDAGDYSGWSVSTAGDVNGDGIDDLIVGALNAAAGTNPYAGETYVILGSSQPLPPVFELASLYPEGGGDGSRGFVLPGDTYDNSGWSVSAAGDVNGDGIDDLITTAPSAGSSSAGEVYVVFGSMQPFPAVLPLASLHPGGGGDGSQGFVIEGRHSLDRIGTAASAAGDVNADGIADIIIGARFASSAGKTYRGESYVLFGSSNGFPPLFPLANLFPAGGGDGSQGFILPGIDTFDEAGYSVSAAGDVNGDGIDDLIIGAWNGSPHGTHYAGESYVVFGRSSAR